jgi:cobalt-zinc-cadmium efflux system protein
MPSRSAPGGAAAIRLAEPEKDPAMPHGDHDHHRDHLADGHDHDGHDHDGHDHDGHDHGGHGHGGHGHHHHHGPANYDTAFAIGVTLNLALVAAQIVFGLIAGSLALVADAGHNFGDVLGLVLSWVAAILSRRPPTRRRTYGYGRSSILAALTNAVVLLIGVGAIVLEAVRRFFEPEPVRGLTVMWVAIAAILINGFTAWLFMSGRKGDMNIRGAFLHMASDALVSFAVVVAALLIHFTGWVWLDPVMSLVIAAIITWGTWSLLTESANLAMDAVPEGVDRAKVEAYLAALPGVTEVHDLHIWGLSTTEVALTAHLVRPEAGTEDSFLRDVCGTLRDKYGIGHSTFQIEHGDPANPCALAPANVI